MLALLRSAVSKWHFNTNSRSGDASSSAGARLVASADACDLIVWFLGVGRDLVRLGTVCRAWRSHVRCSDVWRRKLDRAGPLTARLLHDERQERRRRGEYSYDIDWMAAVAQAQRTRLGSTGNCEWPSSRRVTGNAHGAEGSSDVFRHFPMKPTLMQNVKSKLSALRSGANSSAGDVRGKTVRLVMLGLDAAGKTTMLYRLQIGEPAMFIPTIGFVVETIDNVELGVHITSWDVGTGMRLRPLWRHYYQDLHGVIFVVDANDRERFHQAREELHKLMDWTYGEDQLRELPLLVLANKQDLEGAATPEAVAAALGLGPLPASQGGESVPPRFLWRVHGCIGTSNAGWRDGLDWLFTTITATQRAAT